MCNLVRSALHHLGELSNVDVLQTIHSFAEVRERSIAVSRFNAHEIRGEHNLALVAFA